MTKRQRREHKAGNQERKSLLMKFFGRPNYGFQLIGGLIQNGKH